jgi:hypothetical protein
MFLSNAVQITSYLYGYGVFCDNGEKSNSTTMINMAKNAVCVDSDRFASNMLIVKSADNGEKLRGFVEKYYQIEGDALSIVIPVERVEFLEIYALTKFIGGFAKPLLETDGISWTIRFDDRGYAIYAHLYSGLPPIPYDKAAQDAICALFVIGVAKFAPYALHVVKWLEGLERFDIREFPYTINRGLFRHLRAVKSLNVADCLQIEDDDFRCLINIETLNIDGCTELTAQIWEYLPKLKILSMMRCSKKNQHDANYTILMHPNIKTLTEIKCLYASSLQGDNMNMIKFNGNLNGEIIKTFPNLVELESATCNMPKDYIAKVTKLTTNATKDIFNGPLLTELILKLNSYKENNEMFRPCQQLKSLTLLYTETYNKDNNKLLTDEMFTYLPKLEYLDIGWCKYPFTMAIFKYLPNLREINANGYDFDEEIARKYAPNVKFI